MRTHIYTSFIFLLQNFDYDDSCLTFITGEKYIVHSEWYPEYRLLKPCLAVCLLLALEKPKEHFCLKKKKMQHKQAKACSPLSSWSTLYCDGFIIFRLYCFI